jgi:hypothetical protein
MFAEIGGLKVPLGAGGTHISVTKQSFESNDEYIIEDWDVESYYQTAFSSLNLVLFCHQSITDWTSFIARLGYLIVRPSVFTCNSFSPSVFNS